MAFFRELVARLRYGILLPIALAIIIIVFVAISVTEDGDQIVLATTTSTYDSGLLDHILPSFEERYGVEVKVIAVGTGQALRLGRAGDVDVLLVHAPTEEMAFVEDGNGLYRAGVMHNWFVIVGPPSDPADIAGLANTTQALLRIHDREAPFCSRGDDSGTHKKEQALWAVAGHSYEDLSSEDSSSWYLSLGQGMGDTLRMASDLGAYTLTDEGTYFAMSGELDLVVYTEGGEELQNPYSVIPVNGSRHASVNQELAELFAQWLVSKECQDLIDAYTRNGRTLFEADAAGGIP